MKLTASSNGGFSRLKKRLVANKNNKQNIFLLMHKYGKIGVKVLEEATPVDTGKTAASWSYKVTENLELVFINDNETKDGYPIVLLLINGHGDESGKYTPADDFVRRALNPILVSLKREIRKELK